MIDVDLIRSRFASLLPHLDERGRLLFAAIEARVAGYGGIVAVSRTTGMAPRTIGRGLRELDECEPAWKSGSSAISVQPEAFRELTTSSNHIIFATLMAACPVAYALSAKGLKL